MNITQTTPDIRTLTIAAPRARLHAALTTLTGLRSWWTPIVVGSPEAGGRLAFGFEGTDEQIEVDVADSGPDRVRWAVRDHTSAPAWAGSVVTFGLEETGPSASRLEFRHDGIDRSEVASGWDRFLGSLVRLLQDGRGQPYSASPALTVARRYHDAWTSGDFATAIDLLVEDLETDVPLNTYRDRTEFAQALTGFGSMIERTDLVTALATGPEACLIYDMHSAAFGTIRIAEHFTVRNGRIVRIRHVHDTFALRRAG